MSLTIWSREISMTHLPCMLPWHFLRYSRLLEGKSYLWIYMLGLTFDGKFNSFSFWYEVEYDMFDISA